MSAPVDPLRPAPKLNRARRRMRFWVAGIAAAAVIALIVVATVGGFGDRPVVRLASADRGRTISTDELDVRITSARIASTDPAIEYALPDQRYLVVDATVENTTEAPVGSYTVTLRVQGASIVFDDTPHSFARVTDSQDVTVFQPGLPERVAWVWEIPKGTTVPSGPLVSVLLTRARKLGDPVYDDASYGPLQADARVELPVEGIPGGSS